MNPDNETKTWEFFAEVAAFDGSTEQIDDWVNRYSRKDMLGAFGITRGSNKKKFLERFSKNDMVNIVKATTLLEMNKGFFMGLDENNNEKRGQKSGRSGGTRTPNQRLKRPLLYH